MDAKRAAVRALVPLVLSVCEGGSLTCHGVVRFVVVCGDGEYIIYTAMALRNKAFGPALEFVWGPDSSEYAIRESNYNIKLFKNFKEKSTFKPDFGCESK